MKLKILTYNVFLLRNYFGLFSLQQKCRGVKIAQKLKQEAQDVDVFVFQEVFHKETREHMIAILSKTWKYCIRPKWNHRDKGENSGLLILSKIPIISYAWHCFVSSGKLTDKLASKGILYFELMNNIHMFATHLECFTEKFEYFKVRCQQLEECREFIEQASTNFDKNSIVLIAGDMNICSKSPMYNKMLQTLDAVPVDRTMPNTWINGNFGSKMTTDLPDSCFDYILILQAFNYIINELTVWNHFRTHTNCGEFKELSDHLPVFMELEF